MTEEKTANWWIYIVETPKGIWYTGISTDVTRRIIQHETGKGAKNLRGKGPLTLVFKASVGSKSDASKLEYQVKKLSKSQKRQWVETSAESIVFINRETSCTAP